jgi:hypothetical protein
VHVCKSCLLVILLLGPKAWLGPSMVYRYRRVATGDSSRRAEKAGDGSSKDLALCRDVGVQECLLLGLVVQCICVE